MPIGQHWYHLGQSPCCLLLYSLGQPHILFISWVYDLWPLLPRDSLSTVIWVWPYPILDLTCTMVQRCPCPGSPCQVLACGCAFFFFFLFSGEPPGSPALQADSLPTELWGKSWSISDPCNLKKKKKKKRALWYMAFKNLHLHFFFFFLWWELWRFMCLATSKYILQCAQLLSCVQLFSTLWTIAHQASLSMGFFRQEC